MQGSLQQDAPEVRAREGNTSPRALVAPNRLRLANSHSRWPELLQLVLVHRRLVHP
jgi:hypothetical protein